MKPLHIVLYSPEIPQNTGNISRTCAVTGAALHIIRPIGFEISDRTLKRAGLDYWDKLDVTYYDSLVDFEAQHPQATIYYFSSKAQNNVYDVQYPTPVFLMFGRETSGLPVELTQAHADTCVRLPMLPDRRCLNLSNAVAVAAYEVLRQWNFPGMQLSF